jgi:hypothetical protein
VEAFGTDLDEARTIPQEARDADMVADAEGGERVSIPAAVFIGDDNARRWWFGPGSYEGLRTVALASGAVPSREEPPAVLDALRRFGRMATLEVQEVCGLPGPRAQAELWRLAADWRVRPIPALTGHLWEPA